MMTEQLLAEIEKYKSYPRWSVKFPACEEAHYHDGILVFSYNRETGAFYCDSNPSTSQPEVLEIRFDNELVFVKYQNQILLNRLPCSTPEFSN
jgi:hypothetical protein